MHLMHLIDKDRGQNLHLIQLKKSQNTSIIAQIEIFVTIYVSI